MKYTNKFAVLRNKKSGAFLKEYKSKKETFAYSVDYTNDLKQAAKNVLKAIEYQKEEFEKLANALDCEILVVEVEYTLKTLDGEEPEDLIDKIEQAKRKHFEDMLRGLLKSPLSDDDEED